MTRSCPLGSLQYLMGVGTGVTGEVLWAYVGEGEVEGMAQISQLPP